MDIRLLVKGVGMAALLAVSACASEGDGGGGGPVGEPDPVGDSLAQALAGQAQISPLVQTLAFKVRQPISAATHLAVNIQSCQILEESLWPVCSLLQSETRGCSASATFFWAHDIPRCSARLELYDYQIEGTPSDIYVFDLTGDSRVTPPSDCGDGKVDLGEVCDDGNTESFDGCDSNCQMEEFTGCETVIETEFSSANLAWIDRTEWRSPRSHLMIHQTAGAMRTVDEAFCADARAAAQRACERIQTDMPFVSYCEPKAQFLASQNACTVRLNAYFQSLSPSYGVFTTALPGMLSFTIR